MGINRAHGNYMQEVGVARTKLTLKRCRTLKKTCVFAEGPKDPYQEYVYCRFH